MAIDHDFLRSFDWARTPVGPMESWPQSLRSYVDLILGLPTPAMVFWGPDLTQIYNERYVAIMGPRHPRYFGAPYRECSPETYALLIPVLRQVLEEGRTVEISREPRTLTRHGFEEETYFTYTFSPLRDDQGKIAGIYHPVVELTDAVLRERRAETLRQLTAQRDPLSQATVPFAANPADAPLVGMYVRDDEHGALRIVAATGPGSAAACAQRLASIATELAQVHTTNRPAEVALAGPGEPLRSVYVVPLRRSPADAPLGVMAFGVSPRLRLDASYRELFEVAARDIATNLLAQRLEQAQIEALSNARRDAEAASRAKDEFFAILGHELRNPLAPITTALQLMRMRGEDVHAKERTIIERQVEHMTRLLDDLLDVSRITRGKVTLQRSPLEIAGVVAKGIELASPLLEQRCHHLVVEVPASGLVVDADAVRLAQVVSNLVANAAKYTEPGGRIRVSATRSGSQLVLLVEDTGIGIAAEMLPRVFEAFAQEEQSLERAQGGLGLGLTIVESLVRLHGGTVRARSAGQGKGSTFVVELPLCDAAPSSEPPMEPWHIEAAPLSGALRILVVDDNVDAAELLAEALAAFGYHTSVAYDGAQALRVVEGFAPDVALLDLGLPVMDGYELAGRLRSGPGGQRMKLVAITGYGQESDRRRTAAAGFDAHLVKPVQLAAIAQLLEEYRSVLG